jgi:hypothetical protein
MQEAELPKLSQTSLFEKFKQNSGICKNVINEIENASNYRVKAEDITDI